MSSVGAPGSGWIVHNRHKIPAFKVQIIQLLREGFFISEICEQLGIRPRYVRDMRAEDKEFDEDYKDADAAFVDTIEREAIRRAKDGVLEPVVSRGQLVMVKNEDGKMEPLMQRKYSDGLMALILKGRRRDIYGDKQQIEQTTKLDVTGAKDELARKFAGVLSGGEEE